MAEESGGNAANPQNDNIVDVPSYVPEKEPKIEPVAESEEPVDGTADEIVEEQPKKKNGYKEKLERERQRTAELEAKLAEREPKVEPKAVVSDEKPVQKDDETYADYFERLADWKIEQRENARSVKSREESLRSEFADKQKQYSARSDEFKAVQPDFDEVIDSYDGPLTPHMQQALLDSDLGPQVAYYVAQHPEEGEAMSKMNVLALSKAIGRIEAKLESPTVDTLPKELKVTKAPPPITPVGKTAVTATYNPYDAKGKDDHDTYMAWRKTQK